MPACCAWNPSRPIVSRGRIKLRLGYKDKPRISFTDLTSFVVMTALGIGDVLTADAHFASVQMSFRTAP